MEINIEEQLPTWLVDCLSGMGDFPLERGTPISSEMDEIGEFAAEEFIDTLKMPADPQKCAALFPRLWFVHVTVSHGLLFDTPFWSGEHTQAFLRGVMIGTWHVHGRPQWEAPTDGPPKWGG